jgi:flavin-dependent dehydrogenase
MDFERHYDVIVAGGGVAGVAAALEAARSGMSTALVEKTVLWGGLATSGLVLIYLPLCDGHGRQVTFGIAEELLRLSLKYGPGPVPPGWPGGEAGEKKKRFMAVFSPASFVLALDEVLEEAGVDLWLDTLVTRPIVDNRALTGIEVENKSGQGRLSAPVLIDATGDADLAFRAGAPCADGDNWLSIWAAQLSLEKARQAVAQADPDLLLDVLKLGADAWGQGHPPD